MSAFYDIWIGTIAPAHVRKGNADWKECDTGTKYALSLPKVDNGAFISTITKDDYTLVVLGQFYEEVNQLALLQTCVKFVENKEVFNDPAGHYILFLFKNQSNECHVFTNRFGTYHAYWLSDGKQRAISTYFLGLARQSEGKAIDWEGITGFLGMGFFPGTTTYLKSIQILAPASYYHFDAGLNLISSIRYWNWTITPGLHNEAEQYDAINRAISNSLSYAVREHRVALPISGGLDSRMLAGVITAEDLGYKSIWSYSYGYSRTSAETAIAGRIAKARSISFESSIVPNYLFEQLPDIAESVELFQYLDGTRQASVQKAIASNADVVVGGHWGDVWMGATPVDENNDLFPVFEQKILKRGRQWLLAEIAQNFQSSPDSYLREYFASTVKQYDHLENPGLKFKAYKTDQWSFRWTLASIRMYQAGAFPVLPFYDKNVADLLLSIPETELSGRKMQIDFIKKYYPDLAKITWQEYGRNLYSYRNLNNRNIVYRAAKKLQRTIHKEKSITRNWEIFYMNPQGRRNLEAHLLDNALLTDLVRKDKLQEQIRELYRNPSGANGYTISMLLTFGTALKKIFS